MRGAETRSTCQLGLWDDEVSLMTLILLRCMFHEDSSDMAREVGGHLTACSMYRSLQLLFKIDEDSDMFISSPCW